LSRRRKCLLNSSLDMKYFELEPQSSPMCRSP
jgi:hypothetical protein